MGEKIDFPTKGGCCYCGKPHDGYCPRIIGIEYDGEEISSIEFLPWWQWPEYMEKMQQDAVNKVAQALAMLEKPEGDSH